jgi:hypothetical protein
MSTPQEDYDWWLGQSDLREQYAGRVVILHNRSVLGSGANHREAFDNARRLAEEQGRTLPERGLFFLAVPEVCWFPIDDLPDAEPRIWP